MADETPVDELEGRELDAAVEREVFGRSPLAVAAWTNEDGDRIPAATDDGRSFDAPDQSGSWRLRLRRVEPNEPIQGEAFIACREWSSSIEAAWHVVTALRESGFSYRVGHVGGEHAVHCIVWGNPLDAYLPEDGVTGRSGPEARHEEPMEVRAASAICRAALKAVRSQP